MRSATTEHVECVREKSPQYGTGGASQRRALSIEYLLRLLKYTDDSPKKGSRPSKGKKRSAPSSAPATAPRRKRAKKGDVASKPVEEANEEEETPSTALPVYRHTFEVRYTRARRGRAVVSGEDADALCWVKEETELSAWLEAKLEEGNAEPIVVWSSKAQDVVLRPDFSSVLVNAGDPASFLLQIPPLQEDFHFEDYDMRNQRLEDAFVACAVLKQTGRADLAADIQVFAEPARDENMLPLRIVLDLTISLIYPTISEPVLYTTKNTVWPIEEAQRRALRYIFPPKSQPATHHANIDVPTLYSTIGPAPPLASPSLEAQYQPVSLIPTLLPFQRRTVAWLLSREHKEIDPATGDVVDKADSSADLPVFWQAVPLTSADGVEETWYINDVTGEFSRTRPEESDPLGGILAEEPGLGKTLESIALILLNPAIGRNPTQKTWNPDARIYVKEVKTTLIVTPVSLAQQWADELKLHAPSLKVLVYDGWSKVKVPITEADLAQALEEKAKSAKKAKARANRRALAAAKTPPLPSRGKARAAKGKGKGKGKAKAEDMDVDEPEPEPEEEPEEEILDWCNYVNTFDVCITTYNVLQQDLGVARPPPDRPRRANATYINIERSRSPLVMCEWYRVVMDEVQMVGGGKTEEMVSLIPRLSSFAVSGTPARTQVADLIHVLNFLRVEAVTKSSRLWARLLKPGYSGQLKDLFLRYAVRTMKASVRDELTIPKQTRCLVPIELGRIERHVYDQNFEKALLELGFDTRGVAMGDGQVDTTLLRSWLRKLRGICTHPQVGQLQNQGDRLHKPGVLKTIGEVLESMKEQNWRNFMEDRRSKVQMITVSAQLYQHYEQHNNRYQVALDQLLRAEREAEDLIKDIEAALKLHDEEGKRLKEQAAEIAEAIPGAAPEASTSALNKGKGREDVASNEDDDDLPKNVAGEEHKVKRRAIQQRLRECQITLHKVYFLKGDVYHVLGKPEEEAASYTMAENLRRILLRSTEEAAQRAMTQLQTEAGEKRLTEKDLLIEVPYCGTGGIKSNHLMEEANEIIDEVLNPQSALLWQWRSHLVKLLTQPLTSGEEDADGQEYARSLETQGEAETYLQAYAALLADRRETMTAERTLLAIHDVKEKKARKTKAAKKAAMALYDEDVQMVLEEVEAQPEDEVLRKELGDQRKALLEDHNTERAVRSVMVELSNIAASITRENDPERILADRGATQLRELLAEQGKLMDKLNSDLTRLRRAFNERIHYFRQLQELSDTVAEAVWYGTAREAILRNEAEIAEMDVKITTGRARQRYLDYLAKSQGEGNMDEEEGTCILCKCEFIRGYITECAHVFCEDCMHTWLQRREGKVCPVCRVAIRSDQLQRFAVGVKAETQEAPPRIVNNEPAPKSRRHYEYNFIDRTVMKSINMMEAHGSYGSKIETLLRHLLYIQLVDPGAKSIVFSAWADSLLIVEHALRRNSISCIRIDQSRGKENAAKKFRTDPSIQVLLLHGERENAGLNVTCASRVFLLESVVHHAFEIQAIARIDRMGQTRPTEVFCYYAEDTVERNILNLAAKRGQSLYTKDNAAGTLTAGPITAPGKDGIDAPKKKAQKGDFVFKTDDMLAIFFPHLFEDIEYLIPEEESQESGTSQEQEEQPTAGPSRLA